MKKIILLLAVSFAASKGFSQVSKGQWMVGGDASFSSEKTGSDPSTTIIQLNPDAGYFFADKFAGGLRVNLASASSSGGGGTATAYTIAPFLRYYFMPVAEKVNVFADAAYGFGSYNSGVTGSSSVTSNSFTISAGPAIFLNRVAALQIAPFYTSLGYSGGGDRTSSFGVGVGFQIHLGTAKK